jgi:hypothetical protein
VSRVYFISREQLDRWISAGKAEVAGGSATLRLDRQYHGTLKAALALTRVVSSPNDSQGVEGRVFELDALRALGARRVGAAVMIGEDSYDAEAGFVLREDGVPEGPLVERPSIIDQVPSPAGMDEKSEIELLSGLILQRMRESGR